MTALGTAVTANLLKTFINQNRQTAEELGAELNRRRQPINEAIAAMNEKFDAENAELIESCANAVNAVTDYDNQLRAMTVQHFTETGEKRMDADCSVRVTSKYQYENANAVAWAETNAPVLIVKTVDKKAFESLPQIADLEFVEKVETATAVIAKEFTDVV